MAKLPGRRLSRALSEAVGSGDVEGVMKALDAGASASEPDETGSLPLNSAAILAGSSIRVFSTDPAVMARFQARPNDHLAVIRLLVERGANLEARNRHGMTPLHGAAIAGNAAAVVLLLELGADPGARRGRCDEEELEGATPLHHVCVVPRQERLLDALAPLLAAGADPNARTKTGLTPLHLLCRVMVSANALEALQRLLDAGADPALADASGYTALTALLDGAASPSPETGERAEARRLLLARGAVERSVAPLGPLVSAGAGDLAASRTTLAAERGCPNLDMTQQVVMVRAAGEDVLGALERILSPARVERGVKGKKTTIGKSSLLVYQLSGHRWTAVQPVSGKPASNRFDRALGVELARALETQVVLFDNSDFTATFGWEVLASGETEELYCAGDRDASPHLVPWSHAAAVLNRSGVSAAASAGDDEDGEEREVYFSRSGAAAPADEGEGFLDRRAKELDLLVSPWPPRALAAKEGSTKAFFAGERTETFALVDYVVLEA